MQSLYRETGWLTLADKQIYKKLVIMFKVKHSIVPDCLRSLFPRLDTQLHYNTTSETEMIL